MLWSMLAVPEEEAPTHSAMSDKLLQYLGIIEQLTEFNETWSHTPLLRVNEQHLPTLVQNKVPQT